MVSHGDDKCDQMLYLDRNCYVDVAVSALSVDLVQVPVGCV